MGLSSPIFFVGLVLLTVFAAWLRIFPVGGYGEGFLDNLHHLFLPALTLALSFAAVIMRSLRASILQVLRAEFVDFARAKGLSSRVILFRHVMRNALIATVTLIGLHIGQLLGGAVITESVFAVPGVGRLMVDSIFARDYPVIQGLTLVLALLVSIAFLVTDLIQMWLDPRVSRMIAAALTAVPPAPVPGRSGSASPFSRRSSLCAVAPQFVAPYDPLAFDFAALLQPPSTAHPFGTDQFGRDILSRVIAASQIDLQIAFFATIGPRPRRQPRRSSASAISAAWRMPSSAGSSISW